MNNLSNLWNQFLNSVPNVVAALIILALAFITAIIVKTLVTKLMKNKYFENLFNKAKIEQERQNTIINFFEKITYLLIFVLWMPGFFERLGMNGVASPIVNMMNKVLAYLPNIVGSILLLIVGLFIGKTVKEILIPIFQKIKLDQYLKKVGVESKSSMSVAETLANIVYVIILIPIIIGSLTVLQIKAISDPAISMLNMIFAYIPKVVLALIIFFVGRFIAKLVFAVLEKLFESIGLDKISDRVFKTTGTNVNENLSLSKILSYIVEYVILILFTVQAINTLKLDVLTKIGSSIIGYLPYAISGILMLGMAILLANYVKSIILKSFPDSKATAILAKVLIIILGVFITLYQLGIASQMVNTAFLIILGAIGVAFAVSFGLGGKDFASHMLNKLENKIDEKSKK